MMSLQHYIVVSPEIRCGVSCATILPLSERMFVLQMVHFAKSYVPDAAYTHTFDLKAETIPAKLHLQ